jgi:acyl carrier protein
MIGLAMSSSATAPNSDTTIDVFAVVAQALVEECDVAREAITPESNLADDFGLDSLAFIDLCFALDTRLRIKIPFESWINDINSGLLDAKEAFLMKNVVRQVEDLVRNRPA